MKRIGSVLGALVLVAAGGSAAQAQEVVKSRDEMKKQPQGEQIRKKEEKRFPLGQSWIAVSMNNKPFTGTERPSFTLDDRFRARGFAGCNSFSATAFPLREQGIAVGPLAVTRHPCVNSAAEQSFLTALRTSAKWDLVAGALVVRGPNGELRFERAL